MTTHGDKITRWFDRVLGKTTKPLYSNRGGNVNCYDANGKPGDRYYQPARIDSYGSHFPMVYPLLTRSGKVRGFILNGDRYSNSTTRHQSDVRDAAQRAVHGTDMVLVIVPFSALEAAGVVDFETIEVLDVSQDRHETIQHHEPVPPSGFEWYNKGGTKMNYGYVLDGKPVTYYTPGASWGTWPGESKPDAWVPSGRIDRVILVDGTVVDWENPLPTRPPERPAGAVYEWKTYRHWLGESLIRAKVRVPVRDRKAGYVTHYRHRWAHFLSGFDHQEPRPLYHLSELPTKDSRTIEEAYEELKPPTVKVAEENGREVKRQGDIFAIPVSIPTRSLTRSGGLRSKRGRLLGTSHVATETITMPSGVTLARGTMRHAPGGWRRPEHVRVSLGKDWHIVVKNTVPLGV